MDAWCFPVCATLLRCTALSLHGPLVVMAHRASCTLCYSSGMYGLMCPGPLLSTSTRSKIQTVWGTSRIRGRPLLTQHGGSVLSDVISRVLEACLPAASQAWEGIDSVLRGIICTLINSSPWVSKHKLQTSVQSCSEAAWHSLSCLSLCSQFSGLRAPERQPPVCVHLDCVCGDLSCAQCLGKLAFIYGIAGTSRNLWKGAQ